MANGSSTPDVLLLAIVARLISRVDGTQGGALVTAVTSNDAAAGQAFVNMNTSGLVVGWRVRIGTGGTAEWHFIASISFIGITLDGNLVNFQASGAAAVFYDPAAPIASADNCFITIDPGAEPAVNAGSRSVAVICEGGSFDQGLLEGGGEQQAGIELSIATRVYSPSQLDVPRQDVQMLTNSAVGVMAMTTDILKALTNWSPVDGNGSRLTRDPLLPVATAVAKDGRRIAWFEVQWRVFFDWDLTSPSP